jgi:glycosyltransferase involved in cell wall biosynthesis
MVLALGGGGFAALTYMSGYRPYAVFTTGSDVLLARGIIRRFNSLILKSAAGVFANGRHLRNKTQELSRRKDVQALCLGADTKRFAPPAHRQAGIHILCTRGFLPVYSNEVLIQALALIPASVPYEKVVFTSSGPTMDETRRLADNTLPPAIRRRIDFLGGVSAEALVNCLRQGSIFVSMAKSDGTSISLLEAMAAGLFPVLSDIAPNREWIDPDRENGILVPLGQPRALAAALEKAVSDRGLRERASKFNRQLIIEQADSRRNMAVLARQLQQLAERG